MIIVVRYFGGTKLGVSGLIKAYKATARDVIPTITPNYRYKLFLFPFLFVRKYFHSLGYSNIFCLNKEKNNSIYLSEIWNHNWYNSKHLNEFLHKNVGVST